MKDMQQLIEWAKGGAARNGLEFQKPDDDWMHMGFLFSPTHAAIMPLHHIDKHEWPSLLTETFRQYKATCAAILCSVWGAAVEAGEGVDVPSALQQKVSDRPDRKEMLTIQASDGENSEMWFCEIHRHATLPPTLGEWEAAEGDHYGRMADIVKNALARSRQP